MKRTLVLLVIAMGLAGALGAMGASQSSSANGPKMDKVNGTVEDTFPSTLHVNASSDPNGANPGGHVWYHEEGTVPPAAFDGDVTCLRVVGTNAYVGIRIDRADDPTRVGQGALFLVSDNGEPGNTDSHLDFFYFAAPPTTCPVPSTFTFAHKSGNFVVFDAP